jgi:hypothetical protein
MSIEQNIAKRKTVEQLFDAMLDLVRPDFKRLANDQRKRFLELAHDRFAERLDLPCCAKNIAAMRKQQSEPAPPPTEADEAIGELMELIEMCDSVPDRGRDFADSVADGARSMIETIERTGRVTAEQGRAIRNWYEGVWAWVER